MAFGYSLMKGRAGAVGYIRETGNQREVLIRDIPPGTVCALYRRMEDGWEHCGNESADSIGNAKWKTAREGSIFIAADNQVMLWEGGDEAFLLANAWLKKQSGGENEKDRKEEMAEEKQAIPKTSVQTAGKNIETGMECTKQTKVLKESMKDDTQSDINQDKQTEVCYDSPEYINPDHTKKQEKENPPERAYTLRPAGEGDPVDTLPERWEN